MKWRAKLAFLTIMLTAAVVASEDEGSCECKAPNVHTVLFHEADLDRNVNRECWTREEMALLFTRRLMEPLIPKAHPTDIPLMLTYFKSCLETIKQMVSTRRPHALILTALTDIVGGYLQAFGLPATRRAYYEGSVSYCVTIQLHDLYDAIKKRLRTDGTGWRRPLPVNGSAHIQPLHTRKTSTENACLNLVTSCDTVCIKKTPHRVVKRLEDSKSPAGPTEIPLPYLDDWKKPCAIAMPFKNRTLYSLFSKASSDILVRYYLNSIHCLSQVSVIPGDCSSSNQYIVRFNSVFREWLERSVVPHLDEETWYPGFGSVLRIIATIGKGTREEEDSEENGLETTEEGTTEGKQPGLSKRAYYAIVAISALAAFWLIACCICLICRLRSKQRNAPQNGPSTTNTSSSSAPVMNTLVSLYCGGTGTNEDSSTTSNDSSYDGNQAKKGQKGTVSNVATRKMSSNSQ